MSRVVMFSARHRSFFVRNCLLWSRNYTAECSSDPSDGDVSLVGYTNYGKIKERMGLKLLTKLVDPISQTLRGSAWNRTSLVHLWPVYK